MMATMDAATYRAFRSANVDEQTATAAAEAVVARDERIAKLEGDVRLLKWITTATFALVAASTLKEFGVL
jgi:LDH2 family malate/lactate/ureidoglycolate dehydrogenase